MYFEEPILIEGLPRKKYIHRQIKLDKTDSTNLVDIGIGIGKKMTNPLLFVFKVIAVPICNKYKVFRASEEYCPNPGNLYFWVESKKWWNS